MSAVIRDADNRARHPIGRIARTAPNDADAADAKDRLAQGGQRAAVPTPEEAPLSGGKCVCRPDRRALGSPHPSGVMLALPYTCGLTSATAEGFALYRINTTFGARANLSGGRILLSWER